MKVTPRRGGSLPAVAMATPEGARVPLRGRRGPVVVYAVHAPDCGACVDYAHMLAAARDALAEWGATVRVVATTAGTALREAAAGVPVLIDADGELGGAAEASPARFIVADEWGEIYVATEAGVHHEGLPTLDEVVDWVRFVAVQCPECEQPEGEWRKI